MQTLTKKANRRTKTGITNLISKNYIVRKEFLLNRKNYIMIKGACYMKIQF